MAGPGLYANIHAKRKRGGKMRKKGAKGAGNCSSAISSASTKVSSALSIAAPTR